MLADIERYQSHRPSLLGRAKARIIDQRVNRMMIGHSIAGAGLAGIGTALQRQLASRGITSAADINREKLAAIPGLGERRIVPLLFWREMVAVAAEREAPGSSAATASAAVAAADAVDCHIAGVEACVRRVIVDVGSMVVRIRTAAAIIDPKLSPTLARRDQALADLNLVGIAADRPQPGPSAFVPPPPPTSKD